MKILILGSEGFIGSYLINIFKESGAEVFGCDLYETSAKDYQYFKVSRLSPEWDEIFKAHDFNYCINAAGSGNVPYSISHPVTDFEANSLDCLKVLDVIRRLNPSCKYLHISSAAVYGNPDRLPIKEGDSKHPLSPYGWHKLISEQICLEYYQVYKIQTCIIRPFSVYGDGLQKQLLWDVCNRLKKSQEIQLFGTGKESRDFIHVQDLVRLISLLIDKAPFHGEVYNAASGKESLISEIAEIIEGCYSGKKSITFSGEARFGDPLNWRADVSAITALGFSPAVELTQGVQNYVKWFEKKVD